MTPESSKESQDPDFMKKVGEEATEATSDSRVTWREESNWGIKCCPNVTITSTSTLYSQVLGTYTQVMMVTYKKAGNPPLFLTRSSQDYTWVVGRSADDRSGVVKSSSPGPCPPPEEEWVVTGEDSKKLLLKITCDPDPFSATASHPYPGI